MSRFLSLSLLATVVFAPACHTKPPAGPDTINEPINPPHNPSMGHYPARVSITTFHMYMTDPVLKVCAGPDPFFDFDSSNVTGDDHSTMRNLADCMKSGALQGKRIKLIGRTDPRGTEEYNEQLGKQRADQAKQYLVNHGVDASRIDTASLGKDDASAAPKDWPSDRRVQIEMAQ